MVNRNLSFRAIFLLFNLRKIAIITLLSASPLIALAQSSSEGTTPAGLAPGSPAGSFALSGFDTVSPFSGKINFKLPLLQIGGRGKAGYTMTYDYNQIWQVDRMTPENSSYTYQWASPDGWTSTAGLGPGFMAVRTQAAQKVTCPLGTPQMEKWSQSQTRLTFTSSDGTEYEFLDALNSGSILTNDICNPYQNYNHRGKLWITKDGSSATFITDSDIYDNQSNPNAGQMATQTTMYAPVSGMMILRDGTKYRIDNGNVSWIRDTNGNKVTFTSTASEFIVTDSLGRQVSVTKGVEPTVINYKGVGGAPRQIKIYHNSLEQLLRADFSLPLKTTQQLFPNLLGSPTPHNPSLVSYIELPDERKYYFKYNYYAELARVELPTGGAYEYDWGGGPGATAEGTIYEGYYPGLYNIQEIYRRVSQRRVYKEGNVLEGKMVFTAAHSHYNDPRPWTTNVKVEEQNAGGTSLSASKHYYYGSPSASMIKHTFDFSEWNEGKEYQTEALASDSLTVLRRTNMTWQQRAVGPTYFDSIILEGANDPRMVESTTALTDVSPNLVSKQTHKNPSTNAIGYDQYNNLTDTWEYDFGSGSPGSFIRYSHTDYLTSGYDTIVGGISVPDPNATVHLRSLPSGQKIYADTAGTVKKSESLYEYDNYSAATNYAPLVNRTNISGLDPVSTTSLTMRGNVTKVSSWRNTDNAYLNAYSQYDIAGNVVKTIDANNNATTLDYDDRFGSPNGEAQSNTAPSMWLNGQTTFAFPSKVTNAAGHIAYTQFDYYLGKAVDTEDPNNVKSSMYYDNDALDRPTKGITAVGTAVQKQTLIRYNDTNATNGSGDPARSVTTISDKDTYLESNSGNGLKATALYDGLGRTWRKAAYETTNQWVVSETQFDALGRGWRGSNPFRVASITAALPADPQWTFSTFDALGRVTKVTSPDTAFVETRYSGNIVTVIDQAKKVRRSITDGLGRLLRVDEPNRDFTAAELAQNPINPDLLLGAVGSPVQSTSYSYDTLDNLTTVNQGVQTRSFVYDSLKRLTSATNPESGATSYVYDANGNLKQKTDALGKWLFYNYDSLNRNVEVISNNAQTSYITRTYDTATNGKGRLGYTFTNSWYYGGPAGQYLDHSAIDSYDALGRPLVQRQHFRINNDTAWSAAYQTSQTYDLAGNLKSKTSPSGRVANYNYNTAGQMTTFTGNLGDGTTRNYATGMTYTPAGQLTQENFGVNVSANVPNGIWHNTHYNNRLQMTDTRIGTGINDGQGQEWTWNRGAIRMFYAANNNGNITRMDHYVPTNEAASTYAMSLDYYGYDHLNRITGIWENQQAHNLGETTTNLTQQYTYDRYGNRLINNAVSTFPVQNSPYTVNTANNRLQSAGNCMTFDAVGNLTNDCGRTRVYDGNNKMVSAYDAGVATGYRYNADGQRVIKTIGTVSTWYIYGMGEELIAEYPANGAVGSPQKEYGYRGGQMLMVYDSTETGTKQFQWLVQDHLGSTRMVVDLSGTLAGMKRHDFLPFGEEIPVSGIRTTAQGYPPPDDKVKQKFTGYEKDTETGLDYAQARYYSNVQGRFTGVDPFSPILEYKLTQNQVSESKDEKEKKGRLFLSYLGQPQNWNRYQYVWGNPLKQIDPSGEDVYIIIYTTTNAADSEEHIRAVAQKLAEDLRKSVKPGDYVYIQGVSSQKEFKDALDSAMFYNKIFGDTASFTYVGHGYVEGTGPALLENLRIADWSDLKPEDIKINWTKSGEACFLMCDGARPDNNYAAHFANVHGVPTTSFDYEIIWKLDGTYGPGKAYPGKSKPKQVTAYPLQRRSSK